jgi:hypothetical protein
MFEHHHTVRQTVQLKVALGRCLVVEQDHRAFASLEELLERENLTAEAEWLARKQSHLRQRVERHPRGVVFLYRLQDFVHGLL